MTKTGRPNRLEAVLEATAEHGDQIRLPSVEEANGGDRTRAGERYGG
jgi:hypothetical protein